MSSHHIIRENQEPALIVWDMNHLSRAVLPSLLEWSPLLIVHEPCLQVLLDSETRVDALITESPELKWSSIFGYQWPVDIIDAYPIPGALQRYLSKKNVKEINLLAEFERLPLPLLDFLHSNFTLIIYSHFYKIQKCQKTFRKWMSPGRKIGLEHVKNPRLINLQDLGNHMYEVRNEGTVEVHSDQAFWVKEVIQ